MGKKMIKDQLVVLSHEIGSTFYRVKNSVGGFVDLIDDDFLGEQNAEIKRVGKKEVLQPSVGQLKEFNQKIEACLADDLGVFPVCLDHLFYCMKCERYVAARYDKGDYLCSHCNLVM